MEDKLPAICAFVSAFGRGLDVESCFRGNTSTTPRFLMIRGVGRCLSGMATSDGRMVGNVGTDLDRRLCDDFFNTNGAGGIARRPRPAMLPVELLGCSIALIDVDAAGIGVIDGASGSSEIGSLSAIAPSEDTGCSEAKGPDENIGPLNGRMPESGLVIGVE